MKQRPSSFGVVAFSLYLQVLGIAITACLRGQVKNGLKLLVASVGYWRYWPNAITWDCLRMVEGARDVLDVSSPKALSLIMGQHGYRLMAVDLDDPQLKTRWAETARFLGLADYQTRYEDAQKLSFPAESFDFVYSISVIEHIPGDGDAAALREIARVLRPGGRAVVEVPLRDQHIEIMQEYDSKGFALPTPRFYERHYSPASADQRLRIPELSVEEVWYMTENAAIDPWIATPRLPRLLRLLILPWEPLLAALNVSLSAEPGRGKPLSVTLHYRKPL